MTFNPALYDSTVWRRHATTAVAPIDAVALGRAPVHGATGARVFPPGSEWSQAPSVAAPRRARDTDTRPAPSTANPAHIILITQVSGPPCAGKSTYIQEHAVPGDTALDDMLLAEHYGGRDRIPAAAWRRWRTAVRNAAATWTGPGRLWIIRGDPAPIADGVRVVTLDPGQAECLARATSDRRPPATELWIEAWYRRYAQDGRDRLGRADSPLAARYGFSVQWAWLSLRRRMSSARTHVRRRW